MKNLVHLSYCYLCAACLFSPCFLLHSTGNPMITNLCSRKPTMCTRCPRGNPNAAKPTRLGYWSCTIQHCVKWFTGMHNYAIIHLCDHRTNWWINTSSSLLKIRILPIWSLPVEVQSLATDDQMQHYAPSGHPHAIVPKALSVLIHDCPHGGLVLNRDHNAALTPLRRLL